MWLMSILPRNLHTKYGLNATQDKAVKVVLWLPWQLSSLLMPVVPRNPHMTEEKGVIKVSPWVPWQLSYQSNKVVG